MTALRALARTCGFADTLEERVRDQIVYGVCETAVAEERFDSISTNVLIRAELSKQQISS